MYSTVKAHYISCQDCMSTMQMQIGPAQVLRDHLNCRPPESSATGVLYNEHTTTKYSIGIDGFEPSGNTKRVAKAASQGVPAPEIVS